MIRVTSAALAMAALSPLALAASLPLVLASAPAEALTGPMPGGPPAMARPRPPMAPPMGGIHRPGRPGFAVGRLPGRPWLRYVASRYRYGAYGWGGWGGWGYSVPAPSDGASITIAPEIVRPSLPTAWDLPVGGVLRPPVGAPVLYRITNESNGRSGRAGAAIVSSGKPRPLPGSTPDAGNGPKLIPLVAR
jgi:hypothetical protein